NRARHGEGRGRLPALRPVRRALPDRRLGHAEVPDRDDRRGRPQRAVPQESRLHRDSPYFSMSVALATRSNRSRVEWDLRVQLAGAYRIADHLGWSELIYTHISARVPGREHHFLINPYGLRFDEVTASNLVKIDLEGNPVTPQEHKANKAGFIIHSAIHTARP